MKYYGNTGRYSKKFEKALPDTDNHIVNAASAVLRAMTLDDPIGNLTRAYNEAKLNDPRSIESQTAKFAGDPAWDHSIDKEKFYSAQAQKIKQIEVDLNADYKRRTNPGGWETQIPRGRSKRSVGTRRKPYGRGQSYGSNASSQLYKKRSKQPARGTGNTGYGYRRQSSR